MQWQISSIEVDLTTEKITQAHWRYGPHYSSCAVGDLAADSNENQIVAAVKATLGAEKVAEIEGAAKQAEYDAAFPKVERGLVGDFKKANLDKLKADRTAFLAADDATKATLINAKKAKGPK